MDKYDPLDATVFHNSEYIFSLGKHIRVPAGSIYSPKDDYEHDMPATTEEMDIEITGMGFSNLKYKRFTYNAYVSYMDENDRERFLLVTNDLWHQNLQLEKVLRRAFEQPYPDIDE